MYVLTQYDYIKHDVLESFENKILCQNMMKRKAREICNKLQGYKPDEEIFFDELDNLPNPEHYGDNGIYYVELYDNKAYLKRKYAVYGWFFYFGIPIYSKSITTEKKYKFVIHEDPRFKPLKDYENVLKEMNKKSSPIKINAIKEAKKEVKKQIKKCKKNK